MGPMHEDQPEKTPDPSREEPGAKAAARRSRYRAAGEETNEWARRQVRALVGKLVRMARRGVIL
jgi:hypothetical protein